MNWLKRLSKGFEKAMTASAFAEEGEFETARQIMHEAEPPAEGPWEEKTSVRRKGRDYKAELAVHAGRGK